MIPKVVKVLSIALFLTFPAMAMAQFNGIRGLIQAVGDLVQILTFILAAIALLVFFWGLVKFISRVGGDETAVKEGRTLMVWGLVALFVMASVWGIVEFFQRELNLPVNTSAPGIRPPLPSRNLPIPIYTGPQQL